VVVLSLIKTENLARFMARAGSIFEMYIYSHSVSETLNIGRRIARYLCRGDIVCLFGDIGSGKTILAKGIARGLGIDAGRVTSPTFVIMHCYDGQVPMFHFDFYRIQYPAEIQGLGYEEYIFDNGISVIEWSERMGRLLPPSHLRINLEVTKENTRNLILNAAGQRYKDILQKIHEDTRH